MLQSRADIEASYTQDDQWGYEDNPEDAKRKEILLETLPKRGYTNVLDIGCGHGFLTRSLPGTQIVGVDISENAIALAQKNAPKHISYKQGSIFELLDLLEEREHFDLIVITGVLYPHYIGKSNTLIYHIIDQLLSPGGILASVHIQEWYSSAFPFLQLEQKYYPYREYTHSLTLYAK